VPTGEIGLLAVYLDTGPQGGGHGVTGEDQAVIDDNQALAAIHAARLRQVEIHARLVQRELDLLATGGSSPEMVDRETLALEDAKVAAWEAERETMKGIK
jgi:hypothetical protein